jgi:hypothetical protein
VDTIEKMYEVQNEDFDEKLKKKMENYKDNKKKS